MDAPSSYTRARFVVTALTLVIVAALLSVGGHPPRAVADELVTVDVDNPATFSVIPKRCYTRQGEIEAGPCHIRWYGNHRPTVIVWGDSHAAQEIPALNVQARRTRTNLIAFTMGVCPPMTVARSDPDPCSRNAYQAMRFIEDKAARTQESLTVVLGAFWRFYRITKSGDRSDRAATFRRGDNQMFARLGRLSRQHGLRVAAIGQAPWVPPGANCTLAWKRCPRSVMIPGEESQTRYLRRRLRTIERAEVISIADRICTKKVCRLTVDGVPVFYDIVHLNSTLTARWATVFWWAFRA